MSERGKLVTTERLANFALVLVLIVTVWAAIQANQVNSKLDQTVRCLTMYNKAQGLALKARDDAINAETVAEVDLWTLYEDLYAEGSATDPPPTEERLVELQDELAAAIVKYRDKLIETQKKREAYPYRAPDVLQDCKEK